MAKKRTVKRTKKPAKLVDVDPAMLNSKMLSSEFNAPFNSISASLISSPYVQVNVGNFKVEVNAALPGSCQVTVYENFVRINCTNDAISLAG